MTDLISPFTATNNSIDLVSLFLFGTASFWGFLYLWENHITTQGRIIYLFVIVISLLHAYQVVIQLFTKYYAPFFIWDIINYMTGFLFLMIVHRMAKKEKLL